MIFGPFFLFLYSFDFVAIFSRGVYVYTAINLNVN